MYLVCDAVQSGRNVPTLKKSLLPLRGVLVDFDDDGGSYVFKLHRIKLQTIVVWVV